MKDEDGLHQVLAEAGHDPNVVTLAVAEPGQRVHRRLAADPDVRIVDFTGPGRFADWLERNAPQAVVFAQRTGPSTVVVDSTDDYQGLVRSLALASCLCDGTVRTTPQNILVPEAGFPTDEGHRTLRDLGADVSDGVDRLLGHPARVARLLGAITTEEVREALTEAALKGPVPHASGPVTHPDHPDADVRSPLLVRLNASNARIFTREWPGPVTFLVGTDSTSHDLALLRTMADRHGAPYASVYSTDPLVLAAAETATLDAGVHLVENLDDLPADPSSDLAEPPGTDAHFITGRFRVVRSRRRAPAAASAAAPPPFAVPAPVLDPGPAADLVDV
ncbi:aldehyde dehydrogenase family protein [Streptomyces sp. NPDC001617]